jgi:ribosome-associated protein
MLQITPSLHLDPGELTFEFIRASGPGGQNVNKVATAVQLRFDVLHSSSLPTELKVRLLKAAARRISKDGILMIEAKRFRTQEQNRQDALQRFLEILRKASAKPKTRKKTRPSKASKEKRLQSKRLRSKTKLGRSKVSHEV